MIHPRSDWTNALPHGQRFDPNALRGIAVHWQGVKVTRPTPQVLLSDRSYHLSKGWGDIAYNLAVDLNGDVWEARGLANRSTANGSTAANKSHVAVVFLLGPGQVPTPQMYAGGREAVRVIRATFPQCRQVATHNDVRPQPTACPGPELTAAVRNGTFEQEDEMSDEERMVLADLWVRQCYERKKLSTPGFVPDEAGIRYWVGQIVQRRTTFGGAAEAIAR